MLAAKAVRSTARPVLQYCTGALTGSGTTETRTFLAIAPHRTRVPVDQACGSSLWIKPIHMHSRSGPLGCRGARTAPVALPGVRGLPYVDMGFAGRVSLAAYVHPGAVQDLHPPCASCPGGRREDGGWRLILLLCVDAGHRLLPAVSYVTPTRQPVPYASLSRRQPVSQSLRVGPLCRHSPPTFKQAVQCTAPVITPVARRRVIPRA